MSLLYLDHFGLNKPPFKITPDPDFFFSGGRRGDILSALLHVAKHEEGIITVVAEVGSGKTLLSRLMISRLGAEVSTVYLANPCFSRDEILSAIARDLGLTGLPLSTEAKLSALQQELMRRHAGGQRVLLVVDEAHAMPPESLEEVRLLSNLETASHKLVNIMLFGQPELDALLAQPRLRQVRDRVIHRFELQPLPSAEACAYIDHRLRAAGWRGGALFSPVSMALLVKASGGRARRINLLADKALLGAYAQGSMTVEVQHVQGALSELHADAPALDGHTWRSLLPAALSSILLALLMTGAALWFMSPPTEAIAPVVEPSPVAVESAASVATPATTVSPEPPVVDPLPATTEGILKNYLQRTGDRLGQPELRGYTLQLAALPRDASIERYLNSTVHAVDAAMIFAQLSTYNGRNFVSVYYGNFETVADASAALAALPASLRTNKPIVRTWTRIKQDQSP
jgi:MSHA biogenesis protein MshM